MTDKVTPLAKAPRLSTFNGFGTSMLGSTKTDADGNCFATRWLMLLLPVWPLGRYYVRKGEETGSSQVLRGTGSFTTPYVFFGQTELRASEVIRTYLSAWVLAPVMLAAPFLAAFAFTSSPLPFVLVVLLAFVVELVVWGRTIALMDKRARPRIPEWAESADS